MSDILTTTTGMTKTILATHRIRKMADRLCSAERTPYDVLDAICERLHRRTLDAIMQSGHWRQPSLARAREERAIWLHHLARAMRSGAAMEQRFDRRHS